MNDHIYRPDCWMVSVLTSFLKSMRGLYYHSTRWRNKKCRWKWPANFEWWWIMFLKKLSWQMLLLYKKHDNRSNFLIWSIWSYHREIPVNNQISIKAVMTKFDWYSSIISRQQHCFLNGRWILVGQNDVFHVRWKPINFVFKEWERFFTILRQHSSRKI